MLGEENVHECVLFLPKNICRPVLLWSHLVLDFCLFRLHLYYRKRGVLKLVSASVC